MKSVSWLHLSDLHVGQKTQWTWPNFRELFLKDLRRMADEAGPIDLILFTGDLTQRGEKSQFDSLTKEMRLIWDELAKLGQHPQLFSVPGNHDLQRPNAKDARVRVLQGWGNDRDVQDELWETPGNQYLDLIQEAFHDYSAWYESLPSQGIPIARDTCGYLPGDSSASVTINGVKVGLIGLNSAFLQLGGDDYNGRLALDGRQLSRVTENDAPAWCQRHDINLLLTHHPASWLAASSQSEFHAEIFTAARFTAHLYGHMHEPALATVYNGGDAGRRSYQSPSLFGMEFLADGSTERAHGYTLARIQLSDNSNEMRIWPRRGQLHKGSGQRKVVPDHTNFNLDDGKEYLTEVLLRSTGSVALKVAANAPPDLAASAETTEQSWVNSLRSTRYPLPESIQHTAVRHLQQKMFAESIRKNKIVWVCADWGLGRDEFLWSAIQYIERDPRTTYRIDLGNYATREEFLTNFRTLTGCSFTEYSKALSNSGPAILLLDDAPVTLGDPRARLLEHDAEELAAMVRDFCADVIVILLSRTKPREPEYEIVRLEPLDEVDTRTYLLKHPAASAEARSTNGVSELFRHSEGFPGKIDMTLKTLRVVSFADLGPPVASNMVNGSAPIEAVPVSLVRAVAELAQSTDGDLMRAYFLLKVLTILPNGESVERLKRIEHRTPVFPKHAVELLDRDLIQVRSSTALIRSDHGEESPVKILVAPRSVRDYVMSTMSAREIDGLVKKAAVLYFGDKWRVGVPSLKRHTGLLTSDDGSLHQNPQFLVARLLSSPSTWRDAMAATPILSLCKAYCAALQESANHRHCVAVCRDMLAIIPIQNFDDDRDAIEIMLVRSLRMVGETEDADALIARLLERPRSRNIEAELTLIRALCLEVLDRSPEAAACARRVIELAPKTAFAAQAQSIVLTTQEGEVSAEKLFQLEKDARTQGFDIVANNLTLGRLERSQADTADLVAALKQVYATASSGGDRYTMARAVVRTASHILAKGDQLSDNDLNRLIGVYHYSYGERFNAIFNRAHESLWEVFEARQDIRNLLALFRHSSFVWRLKGEESRENRYVQRLIKAARRILRTDMLTADQNTAYFLSRAQADALNPKDKEQ